MIGNRTEKKINKKLPPLNNDNVKNERDISDTTAIPITRVLTSSALFDPNSTSPASEFINILKLRMSIYYEQDVNPFA